MIKLTRLHNQIVVVNCDHIYEAGERIIVRETLDELIAKVVEYRRRISSGHDADAVASVTLRQPDDAADSEGGVR
jgi:uncharacterized protein YlzI (FlbEa/FlbD family)